MAAILFFNDVDEPPRRPFIAFVMFIAGENSKNPSAAKSIAGFGSEDETKARWASLGFQAVGEW